MKVVCRYDPGECHRARFAGWMDEWAQVVVSPEEDGAKFASDLRNAEVLLHILRPVTEEVLAGAPRLSLVQNPRLAQRESAAGDLL
jgi:phosphoglycerate dehydrogenase-like enzyme